MPTQHSNHSTILCCVAHLYLYSKAAWQLTLFMPTQHSNHSTILSCVAHLHLYSKAAWQLTLFMPTPHSNHSKILMGAGVEFRVTEEYDEDSPFSRPPSWRPPTPAQDPAPAADEAVADQSIGQSHDSSPQSSHTDTSSDPSIADPVGNGLQPARGLEAPTGSTDSESEAESVSQHVSEVKDRLQTSALSRNTDSQTAPSVGRGQVRSKKADTPKELPAKIQVSSQPDSDQPVDTKYMDTVHQKPGVRRTLDGSSQVAPDRDAGQQGLLSQPHAVQAGNSPGDSSKKESDQDRPWWEKAASSVTAAAMSVPETVSGVVDSVKGAVSAGFEAVGKGQSEQQSGERLPAACLPECTHPAAAVNASLLEPAVCSPSCPSCHSGWLPRSSSKTFGREGMLLTQVS